MINNNDVYNYYGMKLMFCYLGENVLKDLKYKSFIIKTT